jgi:hypothetical protein
VSLYQSLAIIAAQNGKRFASGTLDADSGHDVDVVTGLATVDHGGVSLAGTPTILHNQSSADPSSTAGSLNILGFRPTSSSNPTPIASTTEVEVTWWAIGSGEL